MKKSLLVTAIVSTVTAVAVFASTGADSLKKATAGEHAHSGNHYAEVLANETQSGVKEYWVCCVCHEHYLTQPAGGTWNDAANALTTVDATDDRYIPAGHYDRDHLYEAEDVLVKVNTWNYDSAVWNNAGASGGVITGNLWNGVTYAIHHKSYAAGEYDFVMDYVNGTNGQTCDLFVNGTKHTVNVPAKVEGSWDIVNKTSVTTKVNLVAGDNDIYVVCTGAYAQYDDFRILGTNQKYDTPLADYVTKQAIPAFLANVNEDGQRGMTWGSPYWNGWGVGFNDTVGNYVEAVFKGLEPSATYRLDIEYGYNSSQTIPVKVNGTDAGTVSLSGSASWNVFATASFTFTAGSGDNVVRLTRNGNWGNFNYFTVTKITL